MNDLHLLFRMFVRMYVSDIAREGLSVHEEHYQIKFFLGGDWKFLALICGLDAANSKYACIWCTCPKEKRYLVDNEWSITDEKKGARTVEAICEAAKLSTRSQKKFNCSHEPLFPDIH